MGSSILRSIAMLLGAGCLSILAGAVSAEDSASQVGTWIHNKKESINMPDPGASETVEIRRYDSLLDYTWTGVSTSGEKSTFSYSMAADGKLRTLPGSEGLRGSMTPTPSGVIEAKLLFPDGSSEEKYCILTSSTRLTCFATFVDSAGKTSLFKQIFDKR